MTDPSMREGFRGCFGIYPGSTTSKGAVCSGPVQIFKKQRKRTARYGSGVMLKDTPSAHEKEQDHYDGDHKEEMYKTTQCLRCHTLQNADDYQDQRNDP